MLKSTFPSIPRVLAVFMICMAALLIYSDTLDHSWHFDDYEFIFDNPAIEDIKDFQAIYHAYGNPARSIPFFTFALNHHFGGYDVTGYHIVNIAVHLMTGIFVYLFAFYLLGAPRLKESVLSRHRSWAAFLTAMIFIAHPMQTQAVTYITQRFAAMATMFYMASLYFYLKARLSAGRWRYGLLAGAVIAAVLGMFSKQIVLTLPATVLLIELMFFDLKGKIKLLKKRQLVFILIVAVSFFLIIPSFYSFRFINTLSMQAPSRSHSGDFLTPGTYLLTQFRVIPTYLRLMFFPIGQNLDYDFVSSKSLFEWKTALGFLFLLSVFLLGVKLRRHPLMAFGIFWFFLTLSVESSIITIMQVIFEHRCYLPSVGVALFVVALVFAACRDKARAVTCLFVIVAVLSFLAYQRNKVWENEITLWSDVMRKSPEKTRTYTHLGFAYIQHEQYDKAIEILNKGLTVNPRSSLIYNNRAVAYQSKGEYEQALADYQQALAIEPDKQSAYINMASVYLQMGQWPKALASYNKALELNPNLPDVYFNRGNIFKDLGRTELAIADYDKAIALNPRHSRAYNNRGIVHNSLGQYDKAFADFTRTLEIDPDFVEAHNNRAITFKNRGEMERALEEYNEAIEKRPLWVDLYFNRGNVYLDLKLYDFALADYNKALELEPGLSKVLLRKGIALYLKRDFDGTVDALTEVLALEPDEAVAYLYRGLAYYADKEFKLAYKDLHKARKLGQKVDDQLLRRLEIQIN